MTADGYRIRPMGLPDLEEVASLERRAFANPWSLAAFHHEVQHNPYSRGVVIRGSDATLAAYATVWHLQGELLINNIAVAPEHRRRGVGRMLLEHLLRSADQADLRTAILEVRPSNEAALALYQGAGFELRGRRVGYYSDGEDALILGRDLGGSHHAEHS
jgi:[ribosomal protein S18]-alanine N-acetyltransferase